LPATGPRAIDHLVLPVTTLTLARSRLTSLGFTVAPDARHPFGTGNCCVLFADRNFLEPITILDRAAADMAAAEGFFFVKRIKRFTERHGEGFAMVALKSDDAEADRAAFEQAGFGGGEVHRFTRKATLPDGAEREVGFALADAESAAAPDATFFASQHLDPSVLFQPAYIEHPNGATGIAKAAAVAENPGDFQDFLTAAIGPVEAAPTGLQAGAVAAFSPAAFRARYGLEPPDARRGLLFAAVEIRVADLERAIGYAGPTAARHDGRIVVPPSPGCGAVLCFRKDDDG
jgi:glyoxalase-like protein